MKRAEFRGLFNIFGPAVFPVIHVLNIDQVKVNIDIVLEKNCPGFFLINHDFSFSNLVPIITDIRKNFPDTWMGVNFLGLTGKKAFPVLGKLQVAGVRVDAFWAGDARINERLTMDEQHDAIEINISRHLSAWKGLYFGGTAFKKQRIVSPEDYMKAAEISSNFVDVVTTSGIDTGCSAKVSKIRAFRKPDIDYPLALASGVSAQNIKTYSPFVDAFLVSTGINFAGDFYNIDPVLLQDLLDQLDFL